MSSTVRILVLDKFVSWSGDKTNETNNSALYKIKPFVTIESIKDYIITFKIVEANLVINLSHYGADGIELIQSIVPNYPGIKILVLFESQKSQRQFGLSVQQLLNLGVSDILIKPFNLNFLIKTIKSSQGIKKLMSTPPPQKNEIKFEVGDDKFYAIPINSLVANKDVQFDFYIRIKEGHYVKIIKKGDSFDQYFIDKYIEKGATDLYMSRSDRLDYIKYCSNIVHQTKDIICIDKVAQNQSQAIEKYLHEVYSRGIDEEMLDIGKAISSNIATMVESDKEFTNIFAILEKLGPTQLEHTFLVSFLASMIAVKMDWSSEKILETLILASIFHDIGKSKMPESIREKNSFSMNKAEREEYEKHPIYGAEILSEHKKLNPTIIQVILQHHENCDGSGFPHGVAEKKILNLSKVVHFCDGLAHIMVDKKISAPAAYNLLMKDPLASMVYARDVMEKFCEICTEDNVKFNKVS